MGDIKDDGGPAFPIFADPMSSGGSARWAGLSARDVFAGLAMLGFIAGKWDDEGPDVAAERAYEYADAMLAAREGKNHA